MSPRIARTPSCQGVALVITLVLLSVILVITFTLLAVSRRERSSVTTAQHLIDAEYMANSALERAKATLAAQILGRTNWAAGGLSSPLYYPADPVRASNRFALLTDITLRSGGDILVSTSTNSIDPKDYTPGYITNLQYDARVPVFVRTNRSSAPNAPLDFRFFLDFNRNGLFESNGFFTPLGINEQPVPGLAERYYHSGDPEWLGVTAQAGLPHSATNRFIGRYAYLVVPAGRSLDINAIHNDAGNTPFTGGDGFGRNQGYGTYEINLAAFLSDLNTNIWGRPQYTYDLQPPWGTGNGIGVGRASGRSFDDARSILQYRYAGDYTTLPTLSQWLRPDAAIRALNAWRSDYIDNLANDLNNQIVITATGAQVENDFIDPNSRWPGADNTNRFNSLHDFYRSGRSFSRYAPFYPDFVNRLKQATAGPGTYNRYTFYRLLSQLGTDTGSGPSDRINLNFSNLGTNRTTDFLPWEPATFFMAVADKILQQTFGHAAPLDYYTYNFGYRFSTTNGPVPLASYQARDVPTLSITNIPIYPTNCYNSAVHRALQLAANIFEANNTNYVAPVKDHPDIAGYIPTIFRPVFAQSGNRVWISSFERVTNNSDFVLFQKWYHMDELDGAKVRPVDNIYGVPWIVAASKGYPALNEIGLASAVTVERKLLLTKTAVKSPPVSTNELFIMGVSNVFGIEVWNPYSNAFPRNLRAVVRGRLSMTLTNGDSASFRRSSVSNYFASTIFTNNTWRGVGRQPGVADQPASFRFPILTNFTFLPPMGYRGLNQSFVNTTNPVFSAAAEGFYMPQWVYRTTNDVVYFLIDNDTKRLVDIVTLNRLETYFDISEALQPENYTPVAGSEAPANIWGRRRVNGTLASNLSQKDVPTEGVRAQMNISMGLGATARDWNDPPLASGAQSVMIERENFRRFVQPGEPGGTNLQTLQKQAPYTPSAKVLHDVSWQVNDPLVHYTIEHFLQAKAIGNTVLFTNYSAAPVTIPMAQAATNGNFAAINTSYMPWGGSPTREVNTADALTGDAMRVEVMDPLVRSPNDWQFPTNAYPSVGWIGRVHRGTPWQTVYFKSQGGGSNELWLRHVGGDVGRVWRNLQGYDQLTWLSHPTNDWALVDMFTVAPGENASSGQIGVNQSGLAAWSAVLSGVPVFTNFASDAEAIKRNLKRQAPLVTNMVVQPSLGDPTAPIVKLVNAINRYRASTTNGLFTYAGDILAVPELTLNSPWLRLTDSQRAYGLTDEAYERIPRQILSLVRPDEARFVIYSYGQSLLPAGDSLIKNPLNPGFYNLCTNYQIMAEVATKTVLRFDNVGTVVNGRPRLILKPVVESFSQLPAE